MKFNELCDLVLLGEADVDYLTGRDKVFSISEDAEEIVREIDLAKVKDLIRKTTLPFTSEYLVSLVVDDLSDYLPAETTDLKNMLKRSIWSKFDESEKKSARAANVLFAQLKKWKLITPGIPKKEEKESDEPTDEELEALEKEQLGKEDLDEIIAKLSKKDYTPRGMGMDEVERYGGVAPRSTGHPEDESEWY